MFKYTPDFHHCPQNIEYSSCLLLAQCLEAVHRVDSLRREASEPRPPESASGRLVPSWPQGSVCERTSALQPTGPLAAKLQLLPLTRTVSYG